MTITTDLPIELAPSITSVPKRKPGKTRKESTVVIGLATLSLLLGLWFAASYFEWASPLFLPSPMEVAAQFQTVARDGYAKARFSTTSCRASGASAPRLPSHWRSAFRWG